MIEVIAGTCEHVTFRYSGTVYIIHMANISIDSHEDDVTRAVKAHLADLGITQAAAARIAINGMSIQQSQSMVEAI